MGVPEQEEKEQGYKAKCSIKYLLKCFCILGKIRTSRVRILKVPLIEFTKKNSLRNIIVNRSKIEDKG